MHSLGHFKLQKFNPVDLLPNNNVRGAQICQDLESTLLEAFSRGLEPSLSAWLARRKETVSWAQSSLNERGISISDFSSSSFTEEFQGKQISLELDREKDWE